MERDVYILAVESSCDETAAAVVRNGREVLSNVIYTQIALHTEYGGVVPEIASRKHIEKINQVIGQALRDSGKKLKEMTAIAVTYGPGLVGALLVPIILKIRIWSLRLSVWWYPEDIRILLWLRITGSMRLSEEQEMMRRERPLIRWRVPLG